MKKFLIKISFVVLGTAFLYVILFYIFKIYIHEKKWNQLPNHEVLLIGDSHIETSINHDLWKNSLNFSKSGDCYLYTYTKLKKVLSLNKNTKTVIIPIDYHNLSEKSMNYYKKADILETKLPLNLYIGSAKEFNTLLKINPYSSIKSIFNCLSYKFLIQNPYLNQYGGYVALNKIIGEKEKKDFEKTFNLNYNPHQINYLKMIKKLCESKKIKLYLITVPKYPHNNILKEREHIQNFVTKNNFNWINFDVCKQLNDSSFSDVYHLNKYGAETFTPILKNYLDSINN